MATVFAYKYNNYYNRILKSEVSLDAYGDPIYMESTTYLSFNPNDGVDTKGLTVFGTGSNPYYGDCDYVIYSEDNVNITSRWFIIEQKRKAEGQYDVQLHRDVLVDFKEQVLNADCFIEKAILPDSNPLILNSENITVNQIKTSETQLKDETGIAWIVGYLARSYAGGNQMSLQADTIPDLTYNSLADFQSQFYNKDTIYRIINKDSLYEKVTLKFSTYQGIPNTYYTEKYLWTITFQRRNVTVVSELASGHYDFAAQPQIDRDSLFNSILANCDTSILRNNQSQYISSGNYIEGNFNNFLSKNGKILNTTDNGLYYTINTQYNTETIQEYNVPQNTTVYNHIKSLFDSAGYHNREIPDLRYVVNSQEASYSLTQVAFGTYNLTFPATNTRFHLKDAPYDMFCIPYGDITIKNTKVPGWTDINIEKSLSLSLAQEIAKELGKDNIYDLQLLPYCPMSGFNFGTGYIDINTNSLLRYTLINKVSDSSKANIILWSTASSGTKNISINIPVSNKKLENECDLYRLVSPNYNGQFEFNAAKNNGVLNINVDYTYLPYNPYIHLNPTFSGLYGQDFNDNRGLICQGDFSISYLSDAWVNYQVANKNYQNTFDRQIQNYETQYKYQNIQATVGIASGALSTGAMAGMVTGNPLAGLAGGFLSAIGGIADLQIQKALQNETLDYTKDQFGYQLDNIKALPYSMAKTTAYNENNKIFPIIEKFTCTDTEKIAVANKIAWNSMKVGVIDVLQNYVNNSWSYNNITDKGYIKAKLIRIANIEDDYHLIKAIADELYKGVYTKWE